MFRFDDTPKFFWWAHMPAFFV